MANSSSFFILINALFSINCCAGQLIITATIQTVQLATYNDGHKIAFSLWRKWIKTVECGILAIKKAFVKTLEMGLYSVFLIVPIKRVQEK